jgi:diaminohydroxyphosphoribosylaminopyrimidine deaminase/5-amino-6-(5-phosphoribosylamino)uracil reductase
MRQALREPTEEARLRDLIHDLAQRARDFRFQVAPNPCVGAAVLSRGCVVGRGFHETWGGPHAEVAALRDAASSGVARESWDTLVVTLEPCSSVGKTGPCTEAIREAGIGRVVAAELDPDPRHRGNGLAQLQEAGIEVELLEQSAPLADVASHFLSWNTFERIRRPRPWVIAKWAQTRSGQLMPPSDVGDGRWISSAGSRAEVQVLRSHVDAIVTGVGTVRADDPRMTVRPPGNVARPPLRVVLDTELFTPPSARILERPRTADEAGGATAILCRPGADVGRYRRLVEAGAEVHSMKSDPRRGLSLRHVLDWLWERGAQRVLLECGATLLESFLASGFVDQLCVYTGAVNGGEGPSIAHQLGAIELRDRMHRESGPDSVLEAFPRVRT